MKLSCLAQANLQLQGICVLANGFACNSHKTTGISIEPWLKRCGNSLGERPCRAYFDGVIFIRPCGAHSLTRNPYKVLATFSPKSYLLICNYVQKHRDWLSSGDPILMETIGFCFFCFQGLAGPVSRAVRLAIHSANWPCQTA